jgi:hypothetical protein
MIPSHHTSKDDRVTIFISGKSSTDELTVLKNWGGERCAQGVGGEA